MVSWSGVVDRLHIVLMITRLQEFFILGVDKSFGSAIPPIVASHFLTASLQVTPIPE